MKKAESVSTVLSLPYFLRTVGYRLYLQFTYQTGVFMD